MPVHAIAAAQTVPFAGDVDRNLEQHLALAAQAARAEVEILAFPELSLTGYELPLAAELAFSPTDGRLASLQEAARNAAMVLVVGAPVRIDGRLHIGAFIISPDGQLAVYTKHQLGAFSSEVNPGGPVPPPEAKIFTPGDQDPVVERAGDRVAIGICAESLGNTHPQRAAELGASLYLTCHFGIPLDVDLRLDTLRGHAKRLGMTVVFANYGGPTGGLPGGGKSAIWSADGTCLAQLPASGTGLVMARRVGDQWQGLAET